jgi:CubicO group peptidase (beta-lactamase class C family)
MTQTPCRPQSRGRRLACLGILSLTLTASPAIARDVDSQVSARLREPMQRFVDQGDISGAVVLVGDADGVVGVEAVGRRNLKDDLPMRPDTLFRIASMTKPITAIGIMMLADEGKLAVDDPVEKHLPEFRGQWLVAERSNDATTLKKPSRPITLRDLLTHTSGLPGMPPPGLAELYARRNRTLAEAVMAYSQRPLEFEPGSKWSYCNVGIDTLGRAIEVVSGQSYESFLKDRLFDPLGMADTTFYPTPEQLERAAVTYDRKEGELRPVNASVIGPPTGAKYPIPAGGLYSSAPDLARLYRMMLNRGAADGRRYLSESSVDAMTQVQTGELKTGFTEGMGFGLGWGVVRQPSGVTERLSPGTFGHGGAFGTQAWIDPRAGRFMILMIQRAGLANSDASEIRREIQKAAFPERAE